LGCVQNAHALEIRVLLDFIASKCALKLLIAATQVLCLLKASEVTLHQNDWNCCDLFSFFSSQLSFLLFSQHTLVSELGRCLRFSLLLARHKSCASAVSSFQPVPPSALRDNPYLCLRMRPFPGHQAVTDLIC